MEKERRIIELGGITFVREDCMKMLREYKEAGMYKHFHVGIVDPPYGIDVTNRNMGASSVAERKSKKYNDESWDNEVPTDEYWELLSYCCRDIICWGGNYFTDKIKWSGRCFVVWDKLSAGTGLSFADAELALTTFDANAKIVKYARNRTTRYDGEKRNTTQKPEYLYDFLYVNFVKPGYKVLDTHGGSMTHAVSALKNHINLTIIEISEVQFDSALSAFRDQLIQPRLF